MEFDPVARQLHALIVDDSVMTRKMVMKSLSETGLAAFSFTEAGDGAEALEKFQPGSFDLMFVDMKMPRMDGIEFLQELHSIHVNCPPAVMVTAEAQESVVKDAIDRAKVDAFLLKPVDAERLRKGLANIVQAIPEKSGQWSVPHGDAASLALETVLEQTTGMKIQPVLDAIQFDQGDVVFANITIMGQVQWSLVLGFEGQTASQISSKFAGFEIPFESPDLGDAIGEVANLAAGEAKRILAQRGLDVEISLPTVVAANNFRTLVQKKRRTTEDIVYYQSEAGSLWVGVTVGMVSGLIL
jgi:CheY-like chemotaxis protein/CheY-specific phosphatase CheX